MKFIVHVGPGKTGSSAIQKWLVENRELLLTKGIYYPKHKLDANGISSGNWECAFTRDDKEEIALDRDKCQKIEKAAKKLQCNSILISSEALHESMGAIAEQLDDCVIVYYLRNPLEIIESLYNQSVKRHFNTSKIFLPKNPQFPQLRKITELMKGPYRDKAQVRYYGREFWESGDLVVDFLQSLGLCSSDLGGQKSEKVNLSYTLEGLEFKRLFNRIPEQHIHRKLDVFLQGLEYGERDYSFIDESVFNSYRSDAVKRFKLILSDSSESKKFLDSVQTSQPRPYKTQQLSFEALTDILGILKHTDRKLFNQLYSLVGDYKGLFNESEKLLLVFKELSGKQTLVKKVLRKIRTKVDRKHLVSDKTLPSEPIITAESLQSFCNGLTIPKNIEEADVLRELALLADKNGNLSLAYQLMLQARELRPKGSIINQKLSEYVTRLQALKDQKV